MPELVNIDDWSATAGVTDPIEQRKQYANYVREEYLKEDDEASVKGRDYNSKIEEYIQNSLVGGLYADGLSEEEVSRALQPDPLTFEEKKEKVERAGFFDPLTNERQPLLDYDAFLKVVESGEATDEFLTKESGLRAAAEKLVDSKYNQSVLKLVESGAVPFARVLMPDGTFSVRGGNAAAGLSPYEAYKKSLSAGFVEESDASEIYRKMAVPEGASVPQYKLDNYEEGLMGLDFLMREEGSAEKYKGLHETLEFYAKGLGQTLSGGEAALRERQEDVVREMISALPALEAVPHEDLMAGVHFVAGRIAMRNEFIKYDKDNFSNNIRTFGYGNRAIHNVLLGKRQEFDEALEQVPDEDRAEFKAMRMNELDAQFGSYDQVFNDTYLESRWQDHLTRGMAEGKTKAVILDGFLATEDYSKFSNVWLGTIGRSVIDSFVDIGAGLGAAGAALFGEKATVATDVLVHNHRQREARRRLAQIFGEGFGGVTEIGSMVAPLVFDVTATGLLTMTTGVGGAAYMAAVTSARTGARMTMKGVGASLVKGALRKKAGETSKEAAERLVTNNLIKSVGKKGGKELVSARMAMQAYAKTMAGKTKLGLTGRYASMFIPAATRSGSMTYAGVYHALEGQDLTDEERHDKAVGAGLMASVVTGGLVVGFSAIGRGAVEDVAVGRITRAQTRTYLEELSRRRADDKGLGLIRSMGAQKALLFDRVTGEIVKEGLKKNFFRTVAGSGVGRMAKNYTDEALEEGIDEFINTYIQGYWTGDDVRLEDALRSAGLAAMYGGVLGAAVPMFQGTVGRMARGKDVIKRERQLASQYAVAKQISDRLRKVSNRLEKAGSPEAAQAAAELANVEEVQRRLQQAARQTTKVLEGQEDPEIDLTEYTEPPIYRETPEGELELDLRDPRRALPPTEEQLELPLEGDLSQGTDLPLGPEVLTRRATSPEESFVTPAGRRRGIGARRTDVPPSDAEEEAEEEAGPLEEQAEFDFTPPTPTDAPIEVQTEIDPETGQPVVPTVEVQTEIDFETGLPVVTDEAVQTVLDSLQNVTQEEHEEALAAALSSEKTDPDQMEFDFDLGGAAVPSPIEEQLEFDFSEPDTPPEAPDEGGPDEGGPDEGGPDEGGPDVDTPATPLTGASLLGLVDYYVSKGLAWIKKHHLDPYDLITVRPELRGYAGKAYTKRKKEILKQDTYKHVREFVNKEIPKLWEAMSRIKDLDISPFKSRGWYNATINGDIYEEVREYGHPDYKKRFKAYVTFKAEELKNLDAGELRDFLRMLAGRGFSGQFKTATKYNRLIEKFDNLVLHGATKADAALGAEIAQEFFGDRVTTDTGADEMGSSYSQILADTLRARLKQEEELRKEREPPVDPEAPTQRWDPVKKVWYTPSPDVPPPPQDPTLSFTRRDQEQVAEQAHERGAQSGAWIRRLLAPFLPASGTDSDKTVETAGLTQVAPGLASRMVEEQIEVVVDSGVRLTNSRRITEAEESSYGFPAVTYELPPYELGTPIPEGEGEPVLYPNRAMFTRDTLRKEINKRIDQKYPTAAYEIETTVDEDGNQTHTVASHEGMEHAGLNKTQRKRLEVKKSRGSGKNYLVDPDGAAVFDNDPANIVSMIKGGSDVFIPPIYFQTAEEGGINLNPAILFEVVDNPSFNPKRKASLTNPKQIFKVLDVVYPETANPLILTSQIHTGSISAIKLSLYNKKGNAIINALVPPSDNLDLPANIILGREEGDQLILFNKEEEAYTVETAIAKLNELFGRSYAAIAEAESAGGLDAATLSILDMFGAGEVPSTGRAVALGEVYYDMVRAFQLMAIQADLSRQGLLTTKKGKLVFKESMEDLDIEGLLKYFNIPEGQVHPNPHAKTPLPSETATQRLAAFLLTNGYVQGEHRPRPRINVRSEKNGQPLAELVPNWDKIVIRDYFEHEFAHQRFTPNPKDGSFPNFYGAVMRAGARGRNRMNLIRDLSIEKQMAGFTYEETRDVEDVWKGAAFGNREGGPARPREEPLEAGQFDEGDVRKEATVITTSVDRLKTLAKKEDAAGKNTLIGTLIGLSQAAGIEMGGTVPTFTQLIQNLLRHIKAAAASGDDSRIAAVRREMENRNIPLDLGHLLRTVGISPLDPAAKPSALEHFRNDAPSIVGRKQAAWARERNTREIERLGLESGDPASVIAALKQIAASSRNRKHRDVARLILNDLDLINAIDFVVVNNVDGTAGHFKSTPDGQMEVAINIAGFYGQGVESVLLHEYLHAITANSLLKSEGELTPEQLRGKSRLKKLLQEARDSGQTGIEFDHATENLNEFIATFFSSNSFQRSLRGITSGTGKHSLFRRVLDSIMDFLGMGDKQFRKSFSDLTNFVAVGNASSQTTGFGLLDSIISQAKGNSRGSHKHPFIGSLSEGPDSRIAGSPSPEEVQTDALFSSFEALMSDVAATPQEEAKMDALIDEAVRYGIPASVPVSIVNNPEDHPAFEGRPEAAIVSALVEKDGVAIPAIYIARSNLRAALLSRSSLVRNPFHAKAVMAVIVNEELIHIAEFNSLPQAELDAALESLGVEEFFEIIDEYTANSPEGSTLRETLRARIEAGDLETQRQMMGEKFRMMTQRVQRGATTEEDIAFYQSDPSLFRVFLRYFTNVFRKMAAKYNLRKDNPELASVVNRMAASMEFLANGGSARMTKLPFDPRNPEEGYNVLARRFAAQHDDIDENTSYEATLQRYRGLFQTLELPIALFRDGGLYGAGEYKGFKGAKAWFKGNTDPRITEIKKIERGFFAAVEDIGNDSLHRFEKIRAKFPEISDVLISQATGSAKDAAVTSEFREAQLQKWYSWVKKARQEAKESPDLLKRFRKTRRLKWDELVRQPIRVERERQETVIRREIGESLDSIRKVSPELAEVLIEVRNFVDALSYKLKEVYGTNEELSAKIDSQYGIYLTRAYRAFNEEGYVENILKDPTSVAYQNGYKFFRKKWINTEARSIKKSDDISIEEARAKATRHHDEQPLPISPAHSAMSSYLRALDARANGKSYTLPKGVAKSMLGNLRDREYVPPELKSLLGEYTPEEGLQNLFRTMTVVSRMAAKQSFFNNMIKAGAIDEGQTERKGFLLTHEQILNRIATYGEGELETWQNMRTGERFSTDVPPEREDALETEYDKSYNYYAPPEMVADMKAMFSSSVENEHNSTGDKAVSGVVSAARILTGYSLASKTMGSLGFYIRNILGNLLFFGPAQGLSVPALYKVMTNNLWREMKSAIQNPHAFDEYHAELRSLNLIGADVYASQVRELLKDGSGILSLEREVPRLQKALKKAKAVGDKLRITALTSRLVAATQAADAFYKIGYFEHELGILKQAKQHDIDNNTDTGYGSLSLHELKSMAAKKVRRTAQSYTDTWHGVEKLNKNIGVVLTPFLRFKTEVLRVTGETATLQKEERTSQNPVIQARGRQRRRGLITTIGGWSTLFPIALRMLFGVGEEEDEAIREAGPDYKRVNTFYYTRGLFGFGKVGGDELYSWDATFLNPFAVETDPLLRFTEGVMRGDPVDGMFRGLTHLFNTYADEQIFGAAVVDWARNRRSDNGQPIYEKNEGALAIAGKSLGYVFSEAFAPRTPAKMLKAARSALGDEATDHTLKPAYMLATEIAPIKPYKHDMKLTFRRFLEKKRDERNRATAKLNRFKSRGGLTEGQMRRAARNWLATRQRIDEEIYRTWLGLSSMTGAMKARPRDRLSLSEARDIMSIPALGMGKRRQNNLLRGRMDRPMLTKPFIKGVQTITPDGAVGAQRLRILQDEIKRYGSSEIILDPTD